jgi:hypothetical protein
MASSSGPTPPMGLSASTKLSIQSLEARRPLRMSSWLSHVYAGTEAYQQQRLQQRLQQHEQTVSPHSLHIHPAQAAAYKGRPHWRKDTARARARAQAAGEEWPIEKEERAVRDRLAQATAEPFPPAHSPSYHHPDCCPSTFILRYSIAEERVRMLWPRVHHCLGIGQTQLREARSL